MSEIYEALANAIGQAQLIASATVIAGPGVGNKLLIWPTGQTLGSLGDSTVDEAARKRVKELLAVLRSERFMLQLGAEAVEIFAEIHAPPPKLILIGAVHLAIPLVTFGKTLGFHTVVVDARSAFATPERFGHADQLIIQWPADALPAIGIDEATCIAVLTHDEKIDIPALAIAARSPARYIGALGSQKTHARRLPALRELGLTDTQIARIHAPIGLAIGARRPEEIAVAIIAQIVAVVNGTQNAERRT
jgi:xanthine dehydrogenase accessory factor